MTKNKVGRSQRINRELILDCARRILAERGPEAITIRKIAELAPCAPPSIYYYFKNKESIISALIEEPLFELSEQLKSISSSMDFLNGYVEFWSTRTDQLNLLLLPSVGTNQSMLLHEQYVVLEKVLAGLTDEPHRAEVQLNSVNGLLLKALAHKLEAQGIRDYLSPAIKMVS